MVTDDCVFCRRLQGLEPFPDSEVVWQFPHSIAILGPWQYYQGYCLLVARQHASELAHLSAEVRRAYLDEMCATADAISRCFQPRKMNYELLGNQVAHLHWHLFPRYAADPDTLQPVWVALEKARNDPDYKSRLEGVPGPGDPGQRAATIIALREQLRNLVGTPP